MRTPTFARIWLVAAILVVSPALGCGEPGAEDGASGLGATFVASGGETTCFVFDGQVLDCLAWDGPVAANWQGIDGDVIDVVVAPRYDQWSVLLSDGSVRPEIAGLEQWEFVSLVVGDRPCGLSTQGETVCWDSWEGSVEVLDLPIGQSISGDRSNGALLTQGGEVVSINWADVSVQGYGGAAFLQGQQAGFLAAGSSAACIIEVDGGVRCAQSVSASMTLAGDAFAGMDPFGIQMGERAFCAPGREAGHRCWQYLETRGYVAYDVPLELDLLAASGAIEELGACGVDEDGIPHCWDVDGDSTL